MTTDSEDHEAGTLMPLASHIRERLFPDGAGTARCLADEAFVPRVHLIGAAGAGMRALSEVLLDYGWELTGSDLQATEPVTELPQSTPRSGQILRLHHGHDSSHVPESADLVIFSPAISPDNPERSTADQLGIPQLSYVEFLGELVRHETAICIAGTHGKTTTSAMVASILRESGTDCSAIIGGELIQYQRSGWGSRGDENRDGSVFVVEACEYRRHFLNFHPQVAAILNIEADHFDCFRTVDESMEAFSRFATQVQPGGTLIVRADSPLAGPARDKIEAEVETFVPVGRSASTGRDAFIQADWAVSSLREESHRTVVDVIRRGRTFGTVELRLPGRHNVENALAAIALAHATGISADSACEAMSRFQGVRRRFEEIGIWDGVTLIDDYAHHPTAIQSTLWAARKKYPDRRIVVAFQPHQVSRTRNLMNEFARSFTGADRVLLTPIFAAREDPGTATAVQLELAERIKSAGCSVEVLASLDHLRATLEDSAEPGDIWLTLGAGNINRIPHEFARTVRRHITG